MTRSGPGGLARVRGSASAARRRIRSQSRRPSGRALAGTIAGSAPGFLLPFAITGHFGVGELTDAYFFALTLATFVSVVYEGVLQANVTPVLQAHRLGGTAHFRRTTHRLLLQSTGAAAITYAFVGGLGGFLLVSRRTHWPPAERHLTLMLLAVLALYVLASTVTGVLAAGLYAVEDFFSPLASMALRSLVPLAGLVFIGTNSQSVVALAFLLCAGETVRGIILGVRLHIKTAGLRDGVPKDTVGVWKTAVPHAAAMLVAVANPVVDRLVAAPLGTGSVTLLELGERVLYAPLTALSSVFVLVAGVRWAELAADRAPQLHDDFRRTMSRAALVATGAAVLVSLVILIAARVGGPVLAGAQTDELVPIVLVLLAGLPGGLMIYLGARLLTATRQTRLLPMFAAVGLVVNVVGDVFGAQLFGILGIAAASTAWRYGNTVLYLVVCGRLLSRTFAPDTEEPPGPLPTPLTTKL